MEEKIILISGASKGIGKSCATYLAKKGFTVYGTSRKAKETPIKKNGFYLINMDVDDEKSVKKTVDYIIKKHGHIDILINNAGWGISGAIEDTDVKTSKELFETNFFGVHRLCRNVLPYMRKKGHGRIINISSIGGIIGLPFQGFYSASKFAVEGYTEALRLEVESFGIKVSMLEPGDIKTDFTNKRKKISFDNDNSVYKNHSKRTISIVEKDEQNGVEPIVVAERIYKIIIKKNPKLRYKVGSFSQKLVGNLKGFFPDRTVQWIIKKYYKT